MISAARHARGALAALMLAAILAAAGCASSGAGTGATSAPTGSGSPAGPSADQFAGAPEGSATVAGGVQTIAIDVSKGFFDPTIVHVKAGIPVKMRFGQGQGCLSRLLIPDLGVDQDLSQGGATVDLPPLKAGEYGFSCGMRMVFGKIVAR